MDLSIVKHENGFNTFTPEKINSIVAELPEIYRANRAFGRQKTQTSGALLTLSMGGYGPYRILRQISAQIDSRVKTLQSTKFKLTGYQIKLRSKKKDLIFDVSLEKRELIELGIERLEYQISSIVPYIEGAVKDIAMFQNWYKQVCHTHEIPDNWDEQDAESGELAHYIALAFNQGINEWGQLSVGTCNLLNQLGIDQVVARSKIMGFLKQQVDNPSTDGILIQQRFLKDMIEEFKHCHIQVLAEMGISQMVSKDCLYLDENRSRDG